MGDQSIALQTKVPDIGQMANTMNALTNLRINQDTADAQIEQKQAEAKRAQTAAEAAKFQLTDIQRTKAAAILAPLANTSAFINGDAIAMKNAIDIAHQDMKSAEIPEEKSAVLLSHVFGRLSVDPKSVAPFLKQMSQQGLTSSEQVNRNTPQLITGPNGQQAAFTQATGAVSPVKYGGDSQSAPSVTTPSAPSIAPDNPVSQPVQMSYPVRAPNSPAPQLPSEEKDRQYGQNYRQNLLAVQPAIPQQQRNLDEVIKKADEIQKHWYPTTGVLGAVARKVATWAGDPEYTALSKDLANVQISNLKAMGGDMGTDAGKQLLAHANGDETYPPDILKDIAHRAKADLINIDLQGQSAQKFSQKYGDANLQAHQIEWTKNADTKIFQAMALEQEGLTGQALASKVDDLLGKPGTPERKLNTIKYMNIKKLAADGSLR